MAGAPRGLPTPVEVERRARGENFPVATLLLPRAVRTHLLAVYGFARLADEIGDEAPGDRAGLLDWLAAELDAVYDGRPEHPLLRRLQPTVRLFALPREPFERVIEANRMDQVVHRYATFEDLLSYCQRSANPIGELVLHVLGAHTAERTVLSDSVCTGLQLVEFWQDLGEDLRRDRVYVPLEDIERFGYTVEDLLAGVRDERFLRLMRFEAARTRDLLRYGRVLAGTLRGRAGVAVRLFTAGGLAALADVERRRFDTFLVAGGASTARRLWAAAAELARSAPRPYPRPERGAP